VADVHRAVDAIAGLVQIDLAGQQLDAPSLIAVAVFDRHSSAAQHDSDPMARVAMPRCRLAGRQTQAPDQRGPSPMERVWVIIHFPRGQQERRSHSRPHIRWYTQRGWASPGSASDPAAHPALTRR
jgi:hypothetical protein